MYCSSCGSAMPFGLSFCNRCGLDLRPKEAKDDKPVISPQDSLIWGIVGVTAIGLCGVVALMVIMKEVVKFNNQVILWISLLIFAIFVLIDALFVFVLLRGRREAKEARQAELRDGSRRELEAGQPIEPLTSITDHTTRTLDPVERSHQTKDVKG